MFSKPQLNKFYCFVFNLKWIYFSVIYLKDKYSTVQQGSCCWLACHLYLLEITSTGHYCSCCCRLKVPNFVLRNKTKLDYRAFLSIAMFTSCKTYFVTLAKLQQIQVYTQMYELLIIKLICHLLHFVLVVGYTEPLLQVLKIKYD